MSYGMYTDAGNSAIQGIVMVAKVHQLSWPTVVGMLEAISLEEAYEEARDTAVLEAVYQTLVGKRNTVDQ